MNEWLAGIVGENAARIAGFILLFLLILVAIVIVFAIIRRLTGGTFVAGGRGRAPRLSVMDAAAVDNRRRLVLVRRDDVEHLILIGGPTDLVVEQNIIQATRAQSRAQTPKTEAEPFAAAPAPSPAFSAPAREQQAAETRQPEPAAPATEPTPPVAPPVSTPSAKQPPAPERATEKPQERPRPPVPPSRPAAAPAQAPAAPKPAPQFAPAPQFTQTPRPASSYPPQPRTVLPQPPQPAARAHPAYPLSQVSKGVISATSGAAAASAAAASLNIAPGRDRTPAPAPENAESRAQPSDMDKSDDRPKAGFEESPAEPFTPAPPARENVSDKLDSFSAELQDAVQDEFTVEEPEPAKENEPAGSDIPDAELVNIFEDELSSELNISPSENASEKPDAGNIEDEMEKLLGELSKSNRS